MKILNLVAGDVISASLMGMTEEQSQMNFCAKTLRAASLLA